jgi:DDE family transposase
VLHSSAILLEQRVYALCLGYEDLNDHHASRCDTLPQTAAEREGELGPVRYCAGWRGSTTRGIAWALHVVILERVIALLARASPILFLGFDATTDPVHGR